MNSVAPLVVARRESVKISAPISSSMESTAHTHSYNVGSPLHLDCKRMAGVPGDGIVCATDADSAPPQRQSWKVK